MESSAKTALGDLLEFTNANIRNLQESKIIALFYTYGRFVCHSNFKYDFLDFKQVHDRYMKKLFAGDSATAFSDGKDLLEKIQELIGARLDSFIETAEQAGGQQKELFPDIRGKRKLVWRADMDRMVEIFVPDAIKSGGFIDLSQEKILADLVLADLLLDYDYQVDRFRKCPKCQKYFYQTTKKTKTYCSYKCSTAHRQAVFQKKIKN